MLSDATHFFPSPAAHAVSILDDTHGSITEAITVVALNAFTNPLEAPYWLEVLRALDGGADA